MTCLFSLTNLFVTNTNCFSPHVQFSNKDMVMQISKHLRNCWKKEDPGLVARRAMLNHCLTTLKQAALMLAPLSFSTERKTYLKDNFLIVVNDAIYCSDCGLWSTHMVKLRKQHQEGCRPGCSRNNYFQGGSCYSIRYGWDILIPPDFDSVHLCR